MFLVGNLFEISKMFISTKTIKILFHNFNFAQSMSHEIGLTLVDQNSGLDMD
jgi:hypothetical protein